MISSGDSKVHLSAEWLTNQSTVCHSDHPIQTCSVLVSCCPFTHTSCPTMSKSWGARIILPSFTDLEGIHVVLTGPQKEAGSSLETFVPSSVICLRHSWFNPLETPVKWAKSNLNQISLSEIAQDQACKSWFSYTEQEDQLSLAEIQSILQQKESALLLSLTASVLKDYCGLNPCAG